MSVNIIYFVHGTTTDNENCKATGHNQGTLSRLGVIQVTELRKKVDYDKIDFVICSDLQRAIDSANILFINKKQIIQDNRIRECDYGDLNGEDKALVKDKEHIEIPYPNGESMKDVERRMREFCNDILKKYNGKTIALVAHKAPQLALDVITKNISWEEAIEKDWRKTGNWQPGWEYVINDNF